ncbi:MAG: RHS repeat-associated core domain-containing protein, partial [Kofleriaceae bacterium]
GSVSYFFGDGVADRAGAREHDVAVGDRVIARITVTPAAAAPGASGSSLGAVATGALGCGLITALALALARPRRRTRRWFAAGLAAATLVACAAPITGVAHQTLPLGAQTTFLHAGFGLGPVVFTDAGGNLLEERRYEPFGVAIDARRQTASGTVIGAPDVLARDLNSLNKRTEGATGWSDHGARWMAPETARWTSTDPPVEGPDSKFMLAPWGLHPYQYVDQNPVAFWDPDGREPAPPYADAFVGRAGAWIGVGILNSQVDPGVSVSAVHADLTIATGGQIDGNATYGVLGAIDLVKVAVAPNTLFPGVGFDTGVGNVSAVAFVSDSEAAVGAQANLIDGSVTVGTATNHVRAGLTLGFGLEVRAHYGRGPDGERTTGFGFDLAIVEFDIQWSNKGMDKFAKDPGPVGMLYRTAAGLIPQPLQDLDRLLEQ